MTEMPVSPLTRAQTRVLEQLRRDQRQGLPAPTLDELCARLGLRSRGALHKHVRALQDAGLIQRLSGQRRGLHLQQPISASGGTGRPQEVSIGSTRLPLLGRIAAGRPIEAIDLAAEVELPLWLGNLDGCFALSVHGDSMSGIGILDGDLVLITPRSHARNGEIVVALVDEAEATLKRIEQRPGEVLLHSENPDHPSQRYSPEQVRIQGVLVAQLRRYR